MNSVSGFIKSIDEKTIPEQLSILNEKIETALIDHFEDIPELLTYFEQLVSKNPNTEYKIRYKLLMGKFLYEKHDYEAANTLFLEAITQSEKNHMAELQADSIMESIKTQIRLAQNLKNAIESSKKAISFYHSLHLPLKVANGYFYQGLIYRLLSDYEHSINAYKKALEIRLQSDIPLRIADVYNDLGVTYLDYGNYEKALEYFLKTLKIGEELNDSVSLYVTYTNLGNVYFYLEDYEQALKFYKQSIQTSPLKKDSLKYSQILNNIACLYYYMDHFDKAIKTYHKALKIKEEISDKKGLSSIYSNLGEMLQSKKRYDEALDYYNKSIHIKKQIGYKYGLANTMKNVAELKIITNQLSEALQYLKQGEKYVHETKSDFLLHKYYQLYSEYYSTLQDFEQALHYHKLYTEHKDIFYKEQNQKKIRDLETRYLMEKKEKEAEIYRLKNIELVKANKSIKEKNSELNTHREHLKLINQILRHDLVNDLSTIQSGLRIYKTKPNETMFEMVSKSIQKSVQLIHRMRDLESIIATNEKLKIYDIRAICQKVLQNYDEKITYEIIGNGKVLADEAITSVIDNIVSNAILHAHINHLEISISAQKKFCEIRISDGGPGIPDKYKEAIFEEKFIYGKTGHSGLGLYIVKKTIENYQGMVYVEDNIPQGSIFVILLRRIK